MASTFGDLMKRTWNTLSLASARPTKLLKKSRAGTELRGKPDRAQSVDDDQLAERGGDKRDALRELSASHADTRPATAPTEAPKNQQQDRTDSRHLSSFNVGSRPDTDDNAQGAEIGNDRSQPLHAAELGEDEEKTMTVSARLVSLASEVRQRRDRLTRLGYRLLSLNKELRVASHEVMCAEVELESTRCTPEDRPALEVKLEETERFVEKLTAKKTVLEKEIEKLEWQKNGCDPELFDVIFDDLRAAGLTTDSEDVSIHGRDGEEEHGDNGGETDGREIDNAEISDDDERWISRPRSERTLTPENLTPEERNKKEAWAEFWQLRTQYAEADENFENIGDWYFDKQMERYNRRMEGECNSTSTVLDQQRFLRLRDLTRALRESEEGFEAIRRRLFDMGEDPDVEGMSADLFVDNDGGPMSDDESVQPVPQAAYWVRYMKEFKEREAILDAFELGEAPECDDWDIDSVACGSCWSSSAHDFYGRKIKVWQEMTGRGR